MKRRKTGTLLLYFLGWLMISVLIVGSVFVRITDTDAEHKLTLSTTAGTDRAVLLALELERGRPEGIRMVKVRPFTYYLFGGDELRKSDAFLINEAEIPDYIAWFSPLPEAYEREGGYYEDGVLMGLPCAPELLDLGVSEGNWYLFCGKNSIHTEDGGCLYLMEKLTGGGV